MIEKPRLGRANIAQEKSCERKIVDDGLMACQAERMGEAVETESECFVGPVS
jgi:hypothetical protein